MKTPRFNHLQLNQNDEPQNLTPGPATLNSKNNPNGQPSDHNPNQTI